MNGICVFLNTTVVNDRGALSKVGDKLLTPVRYLFHGANVIMTVGTVGKQIHHVVSFHKEGVKHSSRTHQTFTSAQKGVMRTAIAVVCLIPGLILGSLFKGLGYAISPIAKKAHAYAMQHFTPVSYKIGEREPIKTKKDLEDFCGAIRRANTFNQPIHAIHIRTTEGLMIDEDPGLLDLNPMKIILEGGTLQYDYSNRNLFSTKMYQLKNKKWKVKIDTAVTAMSRGAVRRSWHSCKRYHTLDLFRN